MFSPRTGLHCMNALPVLLGGHVQTAMWFTTSQLALVPQVLIHGLTHLFLTHALSMGHSELIVHSGRHSKYGSPLYSGIQEQTPSLQTAFGPHGDGLHKSASTGSRNKKKKNIIHHLLSCDKLFELLRTFNISITRVLLTYVRFQGTNLEWVTNITINTSAYRHMALHSTICVYSTWAWTGVYTFFINACQLIRTICVNSAFRATIWWTAHILWQAGAGRWPSHISTLREWSAWWR